MASTSESAFSREGKGEGKGEGEGEKVVKKKKEGLGWMEWVRGWLYLAYEMLFQRIMASHLQNPMPLPPLHDLTCIITGSTSGIGLQIARQLAESGAHVVMAVRNTKAAHELIRKWQEEWSGMGLPLNIEVMELDLLSLDSVVKFAEAWNARSGLLHVLINNAGIFSIGEPQKFSKDGYEEHMQVNHLAPALLSVLLLPSLIRGSPSRIINVNSIMHYVGFVDTEDMNVVSGKRKYTSLVGYSSSKLAQARDLPKIVQAAYRLIPYFIFSAQEGSRSALFAATDPQVPEYCEMLKADEWPVCAFLSEDCRPTNPSEEAHNLETSYKVWEKTLDMIGLPLDAVETLVQGDEVKCRYGAHEG
ncbi:dehydrogenase/reductase SDR family member FEY-like isoform X2 [Camellia sinensis]|uniref:dehydrogenase/reductase SDR family member FEY-like isoform X2 n=1 Tax=Camellia sinensis TaxID=4442 RepID=UPI001036666F|nr:dehydrogenase/reductase SDR family member FEY-like isoform X2 [Camellia sinensis]